MEQVTPPILLLKGCGHGMHSPCPGLAAYVPAAHSLQKAPPAPEEPGSQLSHSERPSVAAKVPGEHGVGLLDPVVAK